jgi:hypothetical protein
MEHSYCHPHAPTHIDLPRILAPDLAATNTKCRASSGDGEVEEFAEVLQSKLLLPLHACNAREVHERLQAGVCQRRALTSDNFVLNQSQLLTASENFR